MKVAWTWAFLDLPEEGFQESVEWWRGVTRTTVSPWRGERSEFATLLPDRGDPWLKVQRVGDAGGVHLDLDVAGPLSAARDEAVALGAVVVTHLDDVVVCRSPGGQAFCLCPAGREGGPTHQERTGQPDLLDQACLDVPADLYPAELSFWSRLTGWPAQSAGPDESGLLPLRRGEGMPLRLLTQRLDEPAGSVRAHVDLACVDRGEQVRLHEARGARVESVHEGWTVMVAPDGRRYCLTEREPVSGLRP